MAYSTPGHATVPARCLVAAIVIILIGSVLGLFRQNYARKSTFVSKEAREVTTEAREVFSKGGHASYSAYRARVPQADPVQYSDVRQLWYAGQLTAENVQRVL